MSPVIMPSAPLALAWWSAFVNFCSYVSGVVGVLMIGMLIASDWASRSSVLIMWKLLLPLSCIMMRRFCTVCPCWMALWSAKALSFPPDHDAMSFMLFFSPFLVAVFPVFCGFAGFCGVDGLSSFANKGCCEGLCA